MSKAELSDRSSYGSSSNELALLEEHEKGPKNRVNKKRNDENKSSGDAVLATGKVISGDYRVTNCVIIANEADLDEEAPKMSSDAKDDDDSVILFADQESDQRKV